MHPCLSWILLVSHQARHLPLQKEGEIMNGLDKYNIFFIRWWGEEKAGDSHTLILSESSQSEEKDSPSQETFRLKFSSDSLVCPTQGLLLRAPSCRVGAAHCWGHTRDTLWTDPDVLCLAASGGSYSCGEVISGLSGSFSTPQYPENYPTDIQCVWEIHVDKKFRIRLKILSLR